MQLLAFLTTTMLALASLSKAKDCTYATFTDGNCQVGDKLFCDTKGIMKCSSAFTTQHYDIAAIEYNEGVCIGRAFDSTCTGIVCCL
ncbi:hypothetical protein QTJ16_003024 [Diplocarpon rosae]|uniref:Plethodontid modulating factor n=1 Tax=Diplocarpon rosae TaxID=946125 RepID=A0AAD9T1E6_9HELO|nr:hypothetical protein QTJ16_003024 [Diplocarpon rosae]